MTFEEAIVKSIRSYFKGVEPSELTKATPKRSKYNKKYFDSVGEEHGISPVELKKKLEKNDIKTDKKSIAKATKNGY